MASQTVIQIKKTSVSGRAANSTTLSNPAELALNITDGIMYSSNGTVVFEIGANNTNVNISNTISVGNTNINSNTKTTSGTSAQVCDTFPLSHNTAKYVTEISFGTSIHATELLVINNSVDVSILEYGTIFSNASLGTFSANLNGANIELICTPVNSGAIVKVIRTSLI